MRFQFCKLGFSALLTSSSIFGFSFLAEAKPVEYVKVCSLYGAGFYYVPGTDTCLRITAIGDWLPAQTATGIVCSRGTSIYFVGGSAICDKRPDDQLKRCQFSDGGHYYASANNNCRPASNLWGLGAGQNVDQSAGQLYQDSLRYAGEFSGFRVAAGVGFAENSGHTTYEGTGFSTSGNKAGVCVDGYIQKSLWHTPTGLFLNAGGMAAYCSGSSYSAINPGNGLPHKTDISSYWLLGGRISVDKQWYTQTGISKNWFRATSIYGEYGAAISQVQINVPGLPGANTSRTHSFWGIGISAELPIAPWGTGVTQNIDSAAMELYLVYRQFDANATADFGVPIQTKTEIQSVTTGARIKF